MNQPTRYRIDVPLFSAQRPNSGFEPHETVVRVEVRFEHGGMNYATYKTEPKGVYLSVMTLDKGASFERFNLFGSGRKFLVEPAARLNRKRVAQIASALPAQLEGIASAFLADDLDTLRTHVAALLASAPGKPAKWEAA